MTSTDKSAAEREAFEATVGCGRDLYRDHSGSYASMHVQNDWEVWQAAAKELQRAACNFCLEEAAKARASLPPSDPGAVAWIYLAHELYAMAQGPQPVEEAAQAIARRLSGIPSVNVVEALRWTAAALQAVIDSRGESGSISMIVSGEKKSLGEVLDLADAALAAPSAPSASLTTPSKEPAGAVARTDTTLLDIERAVKAYGNARACSAMDTATLKAELMCLIEAALAAPGAAIDAGGQEAPSRFTTKYPLLNDLLQETWWLGKGPNNMDTGLAWFASLERFLEWLASHPEAPPASAPAAEVAQRPEVFSMTEAQVDAELQALGINPDEAPARVQSALTDAFALADQIRTSKAGSMCPLCGRAYPHEHSPEEITIYRNGMKFALASSPSSAPAESGWQTERAQFETWFCKEGDYEPEWLYGRETSAGFSYSNADTENMWQTWLARAAVATAPQAVQAGGEGGS